MSRGAVRAEGSVFGSDLAIRLGLANAAGFIAFMPLLTLLAPLRIEAVDPDAKALILSGVALVGAVVASLSNIVAGWLSDRTRSRMGRRRPWLLTGVVGALAAYPLILFAQTGWGVLIGVVLFQMMFNLFFGPMNALLPDHVPDARKGLMSSAMAMGAPVGLAVGAVLAGMGQLSEAARFALVAAVFAAGVTPLLLWREPPGPTVPPSINEQAPATRRRADFALAWSSRLMIQLGLSASQVYLLYFVGRAAAEGAAFPERAPAALVSTLILVSTATSVVTALAAGWVSDRTGGRHLYVAVSGMLVCAGMAVFAADPSWTTALIGQLLYGAGVGLYSTTDTALVAQILPSRADSGRDLGLFNLGNTLPQALAPGLASLVLAGAGWGPMGGYPALFAIAGGSALLGGIAAAFIRGVR